MAELEALQESKQESQRLPRQISLWRSRLPPRSVALLRPPCAEDLGKTCKLPSASPCRVVLALPGENNQELPELPAQGVDLDPPSIRCVMSTIPRRPIVAGTIPWLPNIATYQVYRSSCATTSAGPACTVLGTDNGFPPVTRSLSEKLHHCWSIPASAAASISSCLFTPSQAFRRSG